MIFDDHDMIDDWNISASWIARTPRPGVVGGARRGRLMSYWVYQHLGNMTPAEIRDDGMLQEVLRAGDGTSILRTWAERLDANDGEGVDSYRFSHARRVGQVDVVAVDTRHARRFDGDRRLIVGDAEWDGSANGRSVRAGHLVLVTSVPVYIADGLHDFQVWSELVCDGAWGDRVARYGREAAPQPRPRGLVGVPRVVPRVRATGPQTCARPTNRLGRSSWLG